MAITVIMTVVKELSTRLSYTWMQKNRTAFRMEIEKIAAHASSSSGFKKGFFELTLVLVG